MTRGRVEQFDSNQPHSPIQNLPDKAAFLALNGADVLSTFVGINQGLHEGNALTQPFTEHLGTPGLAVYKLLIIAGALSAASTLERRGHPRSARIALRVADAWIVPAVILNVIQETLLTPH